jgi:hypothetical protein
MFNYLSQGVSFFIKFALARFLKDIRYINQNNNMKKFILFTLLILALLAPGISKAQHSTGDKNRTYYDDAKTKLKEVFMTKEYNVINPDDPAHPDVYSKKFGPYFYYYENGKLKISGEYKDDEKSGTWKYYDEKGTLIKTEKYVDGKLVQ